ncbi:MAG: helix-turn-helix domain-containing protein [Rhodanobacteraceae bacterium]
MNIETAYLRRGSAMYRSLADDGAIVAVYGEGGGCTLSVEGGVKAVLVPLRGSLQVAATGFAGALPSGEVLVTEKDTELRVVGKAKCKWVAVLGGPRAWGLLQQDAGVDVSSGGLFLPARFVSSRELRHKAIAAARVANPVSLGGAVNALVEEILTLQTPLHEIIARCPGRTHAKRLSAFLRLQRVRHHIINCCDRDLDNDLLARMANYSPCHFLRIFKQVFQETPHELLVNERLRRARYLLHTSNLAITEIALASGFENRSAFSRLFHQRFGTTANDMRRQARVAVREQQDVQLESAILAM